MAEHEGHVDPQRRDGVQEAVVSRALDFPGSVDEKTGLKYFDLRTTTPHFNVAVANRNLT